MRPLMSLFGYFTSNIAGSKLGYTIPFLVAPLISYTILLYPAKSSFRLFIRTLVTVCTPATFNKLL